MYLRYVKTYDASLDVRAYLSNVPIVFQGSAHLLDVSGSFASSLYGAIWFTHFQDSLLDDGRSYGDAVVSQCELASSFLNYTSNCSRFGGVGYVVQYNFTALHAALMYETLATEGIVRHATNNQDVVVEATVAPLPITAVESSIGEAEDAFLVWFLVSACIHAEARRCERL
jgi:hypothetical protein